jgi:hypothetical protein
MHCHICDKILSQEEIKFERKYNKYAPCRECIQAAEECFSDKSEEEIDKELDDEEESFTDDEDDFLFILTS